MDSSTSLRFGQAVRREDAVCYTCDAYVRSPGDLCCFLPMALPEHSVTEEFTILSIRTSAWPLIPDSWLPRGWCTEWENFASISLFHKYRPNSLWHRLYGNDNTIREELLPIAWKGFADQQETAFLFNNQTLLRLRSKGMRLGSFDWDDELQPHMMVNSHQIKTPPREPLAIPISDKCPFKELPYELMERVIGYSTPDSDAFTDNVEEATVEALLKRQGLASLIGTCQSLRLIAQRALYYAPCLRGWSTPYDLGEYSLFLNTIRKNKFLASLVKVLRWDHAMGLKEGPQIIFEILQTLEPYNSDERTGLEVVNLTRISAGSGLCILQGITSLVSLKLSGLGRVNKAHEDLYFPPFSNFLARMIYLKDLALEGFAHSFSLFADGAFTEGPCAFELTSFSAVNVEWRKSSVQQLLQSSAQSLKVLELKNIKGTETFDVLGELLGQRSLDVVRFVGYIPRSQFRHFIVPTANRARKVSMEIETTEDAEAHTVESIPTTPNSLYYMLKDYWKPTSIYRQVEFIFPGTKHAELTLQAVDNLFAMVKGGENLEQLSIWMFDDGSDLDFAEHLDPRIVVQSFSQTSEIYTSWPCWT